MQRCLQLPRHEKVRTLLSFVWRPGVNARVRMRKTAAGCSAGCVLRRRAAERRIEAGSTAAAQRHAVIRSRCFTDAAPACAVIIASFAWHTARSARRQCVRCGVGVRLCVEDYMNKRTRIHGKRDAPVVLLFAEEYRAVSEAAHMLRNAAKRAQHAARKSRCRCYKGYNGVQRGRVCKRCASAQKECFICA